MRALIASAAALLLTAAIPGVAHADKFAGMGTAIAVGLFLIACAVVVPVLGLVGVALLATRQPYPNFGTMLIALTPPLGGLGVFGLAVVYDLGPAR